METNKLLIIQLISEDLRLHHLFLSLDRIGVEIDDHYRPDILAIIKDLFGFPKGMCPDKFGEVYFLLMQRALEKEYMKGFRQYDWLASECYHELMGSLDGD